MPMEDDKILSFEDVVLRRSDLTILSGPHFLNDRIIEFYFSYISSTHPSNKAVLLVPPSIAFFIANCQDEETLKIFIEPLNLTSKNLVIFPVNNNEDVTRAEGGTHWSLLAFYRGGGKSQFVHHDSLGGGNRGHANRLYRMVVGFMGCSGQTCSYVEYDASPQQVNGYDCGLYVVAIAKVIVSWWCRRSHGVEESNDDDDDEEEEEEEEGDGQLWFSDMMEQVTPARVSEFREEILRLIKQLMASK